VEDWRLEGWVFVFSVHRRADRGGAGAGSRAGQEDGAAARGELGLLVGSRFFLRRFYL
jgi:hypothetical protein